MIPTGAAVLLTGKAGEPGPYGCQRRQRVRSEKVTCAEESRTRGLQIRASDWKPAVQMACFRAAGEPTTRVEVASLTASMYGSDSSPDSIAALSRATAAVRRL